MKVSDEVPHLSTHVWTPKGDLSYYDKSLRMKIESKAHKRQVLKEFGMKEGGLIRNTDKRWDSQTRNATKPSWETKRASKQRKAYIQSQGGVNGLLDRIQQGKGDFL